MPIKAAPKQRAKAPKRAVKRVAAKAAASNGKRTPAARKTAKPLRRARTPAETKADIERRRALAALRRLGGRTKTSLDNLMAILARVCDQISTNAIDPADVFAVVLDSKTPTYLFAQSANVDMRNRLVSEKDLLIDVSAKLNADPGAFIRQSILVNARRIHGADNAPAGASRRGRRGVNNAAFDAAYAALKQSGLPITASLVCAQANLRGRDRGATAWARERAITFDPDARRSIIKTSAVAPATASASVNVNSTAAPVSANAPTPSLDNAIEGVIYEPAAAPIATGK